MERHQHVVDHELIDSDKVLVSQYLPSILTALNKNNAAVEAAATAEEAVHQMISSTLLDLMVGTLSAVVIKTSLKQFLILTMRPFLLSIVNLHH